MEASRGRRFYARRMPPRMVKNDEELFPLVDVFSGRRVYRELRDQHMVGDAGGVGGNLRAREAVGHAKVLVWGPRILIRIWATPRAKAMGQRGVMSEF